MSERKAPARFRLLGIICAGAVVFAMSSASAAAVTCPNEAFRNGFGAALPDCRAYEQVSPVDKNGTYAEGFENHVIAAEDGPGLTYISANGSTIPGAGTASAGDYPTLLARRGATAWTSLNLLPPAAYGDKGHFLGLTPDMRYDVVQAYDSNYGHPEYGRALYMIDTETDIPTTIVPSGKNEEYAYGFDGASVDGSRVFFETKAAVAEGAVEGRDNLYMWERATGVVSVVGLLPAAEGAEVPPGGAFGGAYHWFETYNNGSVTTEVGGALAEIAVGAVHAISESGDQIYFTAGETGQLYLRRGLTGSSPATTRVSEPNVGVADPNAPQPAAFQEATRDGRYAFFISGSKLASNSNTGATDGGSDLYRYDANAPVGQRLTDLSPSGNSETPNGAEVRGLIGISESGGAGFFVARGVLAPGARPGGENLYQFREVGNQEKLIFVATLGSPQTPEANWVAPTFNKSARVSGDGNVVIFNSRESSLAANANRGNECPDGASLSEKELCGEIFRYDASTGTMSCISCSPFGAEAAGNATLAKTKMFIFGNAEPEFESAVTFLSNLSTDGDRVFFQTPQALVAGDTNGATSCPIADSGYLINQGPCQDVYEWEAQGAPGGSCSSAQVGGGCVSLLTSGQSDQRSYFAGASKDGSNAYVLTTASLVASDTDQAPDFYDATVDGGLESQQRASVTPCLGEGCLGPPQAAPSAVPTASELLHGSGNKTPNHRHRHKKKRQRHKRRRRHPSGKKSASKVDHHAKNKQKDVVR